MSVIFRLTVDENAMFSINSLYCRVTEGGLVYAEDKMTVFYFFFFF